MTEPCKHEKTEPGAGDADRMERYAKAITRAWQSGDSDVAAVMALADVEIAAAREEIEDEYSGVLSRQGDLLTRTVNALRGDPPPLTSWSHHDIPERASALIAERERSAERIALLQEDVLRWQHLYWTPFYRKAQGRTYVEADAAEAAVREESAAEIARLAGLLERAERMGDDLTFTLVKVQLDRADLTAARDEQARVIEALTRELGPFGDLSGDVTKIISGHQLAIPNAVAHAMATEVCDALRAALLPAPEVQPGLPLTREAIRPVHGGPHDDCDICDWLAEVQPTEEATGHGPKCAVCAKGGPEALEFHRSRTDRVNHLRAEASDSTGGA